MPPLPDDTCALLLLHRRLFGVLLCLTCYGFYGSSDPPSSWKTIFLYLDGFSFSSSLCGLLVSTSTASSPTSPRKLLLRLACSAILLFLSFTSFAVAFPFAGLMKAGADKRRQLAIIIPSILLGVFAVLPRLLLLVVRASRSWWQDFTNAIPDPAFPFQQSTAPEQGSSRVSQNYEDVSKERGGSH